MDQNDWLAKRFDASRGRLRAVAYRMLGSNSEADDAVQETWLKLSGADTREVANLGGWLTTVLARVCLDMLRKRKARREEPLANAGDTPADSDPETDTAFADAVSPALLVVLETLAPAERVAFVLHDMFDLSFEEIAPIVGRTPAAARQLASRARRRVRGAPAPDAGAAQVAEVFKGRARGALPALIDGEPGAVWTMGGQVRAVFVFTTERGVISGIDLVMDPERLGKFEVKTL